MEKEYDIEKLNPRKNPYAKRVKKQITINIDGDTIDFFKAKSEKCGIPYQTLIRLQRAKQRIGIKMELAQHCTRMSAMPTFLFVYRG